MNNVKYAWCAGFFDGEGSTSFHSQDPKWKHRRYKRMQISIAQVHKEPLTRFKKFIGVGQVKGPYGPYSTQKQPYYQYYAADGNARVVLHRMWPFLSNVKRKQARVCLFAKGR